MVETKASRLQALAQVVSVPPFELFSREEAVPQDLAFSGRYLIRSSAPTEDQADSSRAGQLLTLGPVSAEEVPRAVAALFENAEVNQVIVQAFVEAEVSGVAFCFSPEEMLVEYAAVPEGVTAGTVSPFAALLPSDMPRYARLQAALERIHARFGACDVEFIGLREPQFVQVRPITRKTHFGASLVQLKMALQELESSRWVENDFCRVLAERDTRSRALAQTYLEALQRVYARYLRRRVELPPRPFIRISDQYFMDETLEKQLAPGMLGLMRLGFRLSRIMAEAREAELDRLDAPQLMEKSILMSFAHQLFGKEEAMAMRERLREALDQRLPEGVLPIDFRYDRPLDGRIAFDPDSATWEHIGPRDASGITVVEGDLEQGPFFMLKDPEAEIPEGVVVVTEQLYPQIGRYLDRIRGVICRYGALSSHLAILAREHEVPLRIQVDIERYQG